MTLRPSFLILLFLLAGVPCLPASGSTAGPASVRGAGALAGSGDAPACEVPVRWRIAGIDPQFGMTENEAVRAVREAAILWERALGRVLLFQESSDGIPIRFQFDERQEATQTRQARSAEVELLARALEESEQRLASHRSRLSGARIVHETRFTNFRDRMAAYREIVEYWNARGGAPSEELDRLRRMEEELEAVRESANAAAVELNALVEELNELTEAHNRDVSAVNRAREELRERFPVQIVQSGEYLESRSGLGRITFSRDVEIRIYQFEDRDHLKLVIAHELGHALGLGHTGVEATLMAAETVAVPGMGPPEVMPGDVEALRALCPEL